MFKKFVILGLVLLIGGAGLLGWVFTEQRKDKQRQKEKHEEFKNNLSKLDEIMGDELDVGRFDAIFYEDSGRPGLAQSRKQEEKRQMAITIGGVSVLTGGTILSWLVLFGAVRLFTKGCGALRTVFGGRSERQEGTKDEPTTADKQTPAVNAQAITEGNQVGKEEEVEKPKQTCFGAWKESQRQAQAEREKLKLKERSKVLSDAGWRGFGTSGKKQGLPLSQTGLSEKSKKDDALEVAADKGGKDNAEDPSEKKGLADGKPSSLGSGSAQTGVLPSESGSGQQINKGLMSKTKMPDSVGQSAGSEEPLKAQAASLERQVAEFKKIAQSVQQGGADQSRPVEDSLKELAQQVSAIRDYAANQQERVKKLQDGYDWNIIRNFCLRIIRCIDNVESRIDTLAHQSADTRHLEDLRDELIFALESTGVESFEPETNSDYHGQEKHTEAIKDRESCDDPKLAGKIAKVMRRGYQYCIDEENVKVVRPAQVKLFG